MEKKKIALIDADSLLYYEMNKDTLEEAMAGIDDRIDTILAETSSDKYAGFLTEGRCFRYKIARTRPYKHNRKVSAKPPVFYALKEYLKQKWKFKGYLGLEADDCVRIFAAQLKEEGKYDSTICSPDKDVLRQVAGTHFNFQKAQWIVTSEDDANKFLWMQTLMGDSTDGIPGIPGLGEKTAEKIIANNKGNTSYEQDVLKIYIEKFGQYEGVCKFTETFKLVYLLKNEKEVFYNIRKPLEPVEFIDINS